jgi:hypothetical protein
MLAATAASVDGDGNFQAHMDEAETHHHFASSRPLGLSFVGAGSAEVVSCGVGVGPANADVNQSRVL